MADVRCDNNPDGKPTGPGTGRCHNCGSDNLRTEVVPRFKALSTTAELTYVCNFCGLLLWKVGEVPRLWRWEGDGESFSVVYVAGLDRDEARAKVVHLLKEWTSDCTNNPDPNERSRPSEDLPGWARPEDVDDHLSGLRQDVVVKIAAEHMVMPNETGRRDILLLQRELEGEPKGLIKPHVVFHVSAERVARILHGRGPEAAVVCEADHAARVRP